MKKYIYFVPYAYEAYGSFGSGNTEIISDSEITSFDDVVDIIEVIKKKYPKNKQISILPWKLLRIEEEIDPS